MFYVKPSKGSSLDVKVSLEMTLRLRFFLCSWFDNLEVAGLPVGSGNTALILHAFSCVCGHYWSLVVLRLRGWPTLGRLAP